MIGKKGQWQIEWIDRGKEPQCPPDPRYPSGIDVRLPRDIADHARLKFHHTGRYNTLQKLTYAVVLFIFFPLSSLGCSENQCERE